MKNKKMKELYAMRSKENDVLREFIHSVLPGFVIKKEGQGKPVIPDINSLHEAFMAEYGQRTKESAPSTPPHDSSGSQSEPHKDLETKHKAVIEKFRETVGKYRLLQQKFDALHKSAASSQKELKRLRQLVGTKDGASTGQEGNSNRHLSGDSVTGNDNDTGLVKKMEDENKKLLSRGKELYQKHKRLKLEHDAVVQKLSKAERQVSELTEGAEKQRTEIVKVQEQLARQTESARSAKEEFEKLLEERTLAANTSTSELEKLRDEYSEKNEKLSKALFQMQEKLNAKESAAAKEDDKSGIAEVQTKNSEIDRLKALLEENEVTINDTREENDSLRSKMKSLIEQHNEAVAEMRSNAERAHDAHCKTSEEALSRAVAAEEEASARQESQIEA